MSMVRWQPFADLMSLREAMDRLFEDSVIRPSGRLLAPFGGGDLALDMVETENDLVVSAALPGVKPEEVDISITGDVLTIKGETKAETKEEKANYLRQERRYGAFSRTVAMPVPVNADQAVAKFKDGVVTVTIPKSEAAKPKSIKVIGEAT